MNYGRCPIKGRVTRLIVGRKKSESLLFAWSFAATRQKKQ